VKRRQCLTFSKVKKVRKKKLKTSNILIPWLQAGNVLLHDAGAIKMGSDVSPNGLVEDTTEQESNEDAQREFVNDSINASDSGC
jgi:hypothetical protein